MAPMNNYLMNLLQQIKANPTQFLMQRKLNVPVAVASDPQKILDHLLQTGQISQQAVNNAYQIVQQFK